MGLKDYPIKPELGTINSLQHVKWKAYIPIGGSGATGTIRSAPAGFACAKNTTGVYDCTGVPTFPTGKGHFKFNIMSATPTVGCAVVTAYDNAAGTMTFATLVGVTKTEPASGDEIWLEFVGEPL